MADKVDRSACHTTPNLHSSPCKAHNGRQPRNEDDKEPTLPYNMRHARIVETLALVLLCHSSETPLERPEIAQLTQQGTQGYDAKGDPERIHDTAEDGDDLMAEEGRKRDDKEDGDWDDPSPLDGIDLLGNGSEPVDDLVVVYGHEGHKQSDEDESDVVVPISPFDPLPPVYGHLLCRRPHRRPLFVEVLWKSRSHFPLLFAQLLPVQRTIWMYAIPERRGRRDCPMASRQRRESRGWCEGIICIKSRSLIVR